VTAAELATALHAELSRQPPMRASERELQDAIGRALVALALPAIREAPLTPQDRVDFLVGSFPLALLPACGVALEVKVGGSLADLTRQLFRYAESPRVLSLLVVTTRSRHRNLPSTIAGKPLVVLCLSDFSLGF